MKYVKISRNLGGVCRVLNTGVFPSQLKIAKVIPIFKKDDNKMFSNYRPISLLPVLSKVVEQVI